MKSFICLFGLHDWRGACANYKHLGEFKYYVLGRKCLHCGKEKLEE